MADAVPLVLACGALVREVRVVLGPIADELDVEYLPAPLHNRPERIVPAIEARIDREPVDRRIVLGYADCGTGGGLDELIDRSPRPITRLPGAHCYEFFAGGDRFAELHEDEIGSLYLTDYLAKHFDALVWSGLGLDRHPELASIYFGNYRRVVVLTQTGDEHVIAAGTAAAARLGLDVAIEHTGFRPFEQAVAVAVGGIR